MIYLYQLLTVMKISLFGSYKVLNLDSVIKLIMEIVPFHSLMIFCCMRCDLNSSERYDLEN